MSVWRGPARVATVGAMLAGLVLAGVTVGAGPAVAQDDSARLRVSSSFTAGGKAGSANMSVTRRSRGCVAVRTSLAIGLAGLTPDQVLVQVNRGGGRLETLNLSSGGDGLVVTDRTEPERDELCERRSLSIRYRVTFLATAPGGRATMVAEAFTDGGAAIAAGTDSTRVSSRNGVVTPKPVVPSPTPEATATTAAAEAQRVAVGPPSPAVVANRPEPAGGFSALGMSVMFFGLLLVGLGAALLVMLIRRARAERAVGGGAG